MEVALAAAAALTRSHSHLVVSGPPGGLAWTQHSAEPVAGISFLHLSVGWEGTRNETSGPLAVGPVLPGPLTMRRDDNVVWDENPGSTGALFQVSRWRGTWKADERLTGDGGRGVFRTGRQPGSSSDRADRVFQVHRIKCAEGSGWSRSRVVFACYFQDIGTLEGRAGDVG